MPETLQKSEVDNKIDPSVAKQWDESTPTEQKFEDMYAIADGLKIAMLGSFRKAVGGVSTTILTSTNTPQTLY